MSSIEAAQTPLDIVHLSVTLLPAITPVTVVVPDAGAVMVAAPLIMDQAPVPTVGLLAAMVKEAVLHNV